ncbi:MAG TPA: D-cysteine desulfhydrase family protein [Bacteroidota bacterium]|nr:D-cysteine desulfhydrase family protein [Bacteroidota bacterium]
MRPLPRFPLGAFPTPLQMLPRLSAHLGGPRIFIKRDDLTGLAFGGNKTRKLEFLVADALERGADTLLTAGAAQSNHCRQTAAAAARAGLRCDLLLGGTAPREPQGNLLLDILLGAKIHWAGEDRKGEGLEDLAAALTGQGRKPCVIPYGGSSPLGAAGYFAAMEELVAQMRAAGESFDAIVFASSSGGTHAGIIAGARALHFGGKVTGIAVEKSEIAGEPFAAQILGLAAGTARLCGSEASVPVPADVHLDGRFSGDGYGVVGRGEREAIRLVARMEGILLDPVYTARAMSALIAMIAAGEYTREETLLFWHTGGATALFARPGDVLPGAAEV